MKTYLEARRKHGVSLLGLAAAAAVSFLVASTAQAAVITVPASALTPSTQYYTDIIGGGLGNQVQWTGGAPRSGDPVRNDDAFRGPINLGFTLNFFGTDYTQFWANNNGNISFTGGISAYTPTGPQGAPQPIISPFFADVDTRNPASGVMWLRTDIPNEIIVTWDRVGYYDTNADKLNSFQLVVRGPGFAVPAGEGTIGFFYKGMQWETGDASGGTGGFGGTPAAVGFGDGAGNGIILAGSIQDGISEIVNNRFIWFNQQLQPVCGVPGTPPCQSVPEPETLPLILLGVVAIAVNLRRRSRRAL